MQLPHLYCEIMRSSSTSHQAFCNRYEWNAMGFDACAWKDVDIDASVLFVEDVDVQPRNSVKLDTCKVFKRVLRGLFRNAGWNLFYCFFSLKTGKS